MAVDPAVLTAVDGSLRVLLWKRENDPGAGEWALPGVFVSPDEGLEGAVRRALRTKTGLAEINYLEQLFTWDHPHRDPRGWVVSVAYFAIAPSASRLRRPDVCLAEAHLPHDASFDADVQLSVEGRPITAALDHDRIIGKVIERIRGKLNYTSIALEFMPAPTFTLRELQDVYEAILGRELNKDSFRRHVTKTMSLVEGTGTFQEDVGHRPAELFKRMPTGAGPIQQKGV